MINTDNFNIPTYWKNGTFSLLNRCTYNPERFNIQILPNQNKDYIPFISNEFTGFEDHSLIDNRIYIGYHFYENLLFLIPELKKIIIKNYCVDIDHYYIEKICMPTMTSKVGYSSEFSISKDFMIETIQYFNEQSTNIDILFKHFYINDVFYLITSIQNLLININNDFIQYYIQLSNIGSADEFPNDSIYITRNYKADQMVSIISQYFIRLASILDIMSKLVIELKKNNEDFKKYPQLKSKGTTFQYEKSITEGKKSPGLDIINKTIFCHNETINTIISFRNEIVHNGCWETEPKIYIKKHNRKIIERFMYAPDMENGNFTKFINRKHFYSLGTKVNDLLLKIHFDFIERLTYTVLYLLYPECSLNELINKYNVLTKFRNQNSYQKI